MTQTWEKLSSRPLFDLRLFRVRQDCCRSPRTGAAHEFLVLEAEDWVNIVALTPDERVVMVRQFRAGSGQVTLEIPGGIIDPGETPRTAAERELLEETGHRASEWIDLGSVHPNPAILSNRCHTFLARGCVLARPPLLDEREDITVELIPLREVPRRLAQGEIGHALVAVAFQKLDLWRQGLL